MIQRLRQGTGGFTLVEIMIVVAIIGLLAAIAVPSFVRARQRSQATTILNEARMLGDALDQYALENGKQGTSAFAFSDLTAYLKGGSKLIAQGGSDAIGGSLTAAGATVGSGIHVIAATQTALSDATGADANARNQFWGPFS